MRSVMELANRAWYLWMRNDWMLNPRSYFGSYRATTLLRPTFFLGVQGGGLTLVSRMLRRHPQVVSVSGNCKYWAGAYEMHTVLGPLLPAVLTGTRYKDPCPEHPLFKAPRSWTYACDELLPSYRMTADNATEEIAASFKRLIRMCLARHATGQEPAFFTDKSQVYTVRVSLIRELLKEHQPRFVLITTNPFAVCYKAASGYATDMRRLSDRLSLEIRLDICSQHWDNSMRCALDDRDDDMLIVRFEDLLLNPAQQLDRICRHVGILFDERMIPSPHDHVPFGSRYRTRWYPLEPSRVSRYVGEATVDQLRLVDRRCGTTAADLGYGL